MSDHSTSENHSSEPVKKEKYMTFFEHLEELRARLWHMVIAVVLTSCLAGFFYKQIFIYLTRNAPTLYWHTPLEYYFTLFKMVLVVGVFLAFPIIMFEIWKFIEPGLLKKEKKMLVPFVLSSWTLFILGAVFVYFVILPFITTYLYEAGMFVKTEAPRPLGQRWATVAKILEMNRQEGQTLQEPEMTTQLDLEYENLGKDLEIYRKNLGSARVENVWSVGRYISLALVLFLAFGLAFDLPVVVILITQIGLVTPDTLSKARPVVVIGIFLFAAILTPPDIVSQVVLGVPMYLLFEISLIISRIMLRSKKKKMNKTED